MNQLWRRLPWILLCGLIPYAAYLYGQAQQPPHPTTLTHPAERTISPTGAHSYSTAVQRALPAVVNIYTTQKIQQHPLTQDPIFRRFFGERSDEYEENSENETSLGSGVILAADGYILTNNHVIAQADKIIVALKDGRRAQAKVIGTDPDSDLAVIRVDLKDLPTLPLRTSPTQVGDIVLAIGNPFGVGQTVTHGIISATERSGLGINAFEDFIQTDAAINPGNSGGALIDLAGNLVGINTAIYSRSGGSMGIGFAIPAKLVQQVMTSIIKDGKVTRGWLGIEVQGMDGEGDEMSATTAKGVRIAAVQLGGPADKGGLKAGDVILEIDQKPVTHATHLIRLVAGHQPNTVLNVLVKRGERTWTLSITIGQRPSIRKNSERSEDAEQPQSPLELFER